MPDITLCTNDECPFKKDCRRHMATPDPLYQSYSHFSLSKRVVKHNGIATHTETYCLHFIDNTPYIQA